MNDNVDSIKLVIFVHISMTCQYVTLLVLLNNMLICTQAPSPGARVVYIDGAFDLFHAGHVEVIFVVHFIICQ
jgi:bifunctional ADP-heptose synthase (sugar kinase/adenylyltransferase)